MDDGWIGPLEEMLYYLSLAGADKDTEGRYLIHGQPVVIGIGGAEAVVPGATEYSVDGHRCKLAAGLRTTSYGVAVKVY